MEVTTQSYRASILHFTCDPLNEERGYEWFEDGLLVVRDGIVELLGDYATLQHELSDDVVVTDYSGKLIVPGFIDTHLHFPQTEMIASPAEGLLPWLENYTFPNERKFEDPAHARRVAGIFLDELLKNGTTTAMIYSSVHKSSTEVLFEESARRGCRMVAGKVLMDRNCPEFLRDSAESGALDTEALIQQWHNQKRQMVAITPRFAPTSSDEQMRLAGELARRYPDVFLQTHVAENRDEVEWVKSLYPKARSYLDVYDKFGMLRPRSMYGHGIWLDNADRKALVANKAAVAVCPTSNLFLGSGLFDFKAADEHGVLLSLATDVGGGTSFSMLQTMNESYKVARMSGVYLPALRLFYLATLGAAKAMQLDDTIGSFQRGREADFIVLDPNATRILSCRTESAESLEELLFALAILGDDRAISATYVLGKQQLPKN